MNMGGVTGLVAVILIFGMPVIIVGLIAYFRSRDRAEMQKTLRMSIEKGQPLPTEFVESMQKATPKAKNPMNDVRAGLILIAIAAGLLLWNYIDAGFVGDHMSGFAAIPGLIGLALLILGIIGMNTRKS